MPSTEDKLGALWLKTSSKGDYFTGQIGDQRVVIFPNGFKSKDTHPDWIVYKHRPRESD